MVAPSSQRPRPQPGAPAASLQSALSGNETLAGLLERLAQSQARWAVVAALLPPELAAATRGGSLDDKAWVILADHAAAAAKLRQCLPDIERALQAHGWLAPPLKVKVRPRVG